MIERRKVYKVLDPATLSTPFPKKKEKKKVGDRPCQCHFKFIIISIEISKKKRISSLPTFHPL